MITTKKAIVINSADRISGTPSNFLVQFNNNTRQYQKCTSFYVRSVMINNSFMLLIILITNSYLLHHHKNIHSLLHPEIIHILI